MRQFLVSAAMGLLSTAAGFGADRPNIIVIMADDAGYNEFGFTNQLTGYSSTYPVTPNLDALAAQSIVMRQGYTTSPLCTGARSGLLLGQYQQRFGIDNAFDSSDINVPYGLPAGQTTLPSALKSLGYTTGAIGKWHQGFTAGVNRPLDVGFDEFFGFLGGGRSYFVGEYYNPTVQMRRGDTIIEVSSTSNWKTPENGGYTTDAFGQEAVSFINRHANDENPFFLYVAFTNPHSPWYQGPNGNGTTVADYYHPQIAQIPDETNRIVAALNYAMDRNVGSIMSALEHQGIDDNTIIVFLNDNGGPAYPGVYNPTRGNNEPFRGFKGHTLEGGIRVPFFMKVPEMAGGVYDRPVTSHDLLPTFFAAAGGDVSQLQTDGVNLLPFLSGEASGDPRDLIFWRDRTFWAVRRGDWKYARPIEPGFDWPYLWNLAETIVETGATSQLNAHPEIAAELSREFTYWEATLAKPQWGWFGTPNDRNHFDHFVFHNDLPPVTTWSTANAWKQAGTANNKTLLTDDAYANAIIEFTTRDDADYTATNDLARLSGFTFMLNQLRLTGGFQGVANRTATIQGGTLNTTINGRNSVTSASDLLFTKSLTGELPRLQLDATSSDTSARFKFQISHNLQLLDDLEISGDGTQEFVINGRIVDYWEPRNVTKSGTSKVTLTANNSFKGTLTIDAGQLALRGTSAALSGVAKVVVGNSGTGIFSIEGGAIAHSVAGTVGRNGHLGKVEVAGANVNAMQRSTWNNSSLLTIGDDGNGELLITDGALVSSDDAVVGGESGGSGSVIVTGTDPLATNPSTWAIERELIIGLLGNGTLSVEEGGLVTNSTGYVGHSTGSHGNVVVTGTDSTSTHHSTWSTSGSLYLGGNETQSGGSGILDVNTGGVVNVGESLVLWVDAAVNLQGGTIHLANLVLAGGEFNFNHGTVSLPSHQTIGSDGLIADVLNGDLIIGVGQHIRIQERGTLEAPLEIRGGTLSVGELINPHFLTFEAGTFNLTEADLIVASDGLFGSLLTVGSGRELNVSNTASIATDALLIIEPDAKFSAGILNNSGELRLGGDTAVLGGTNINNAGLLRGVGRINAVVSNAQSIEAFDQVGELVFNATLTNEAVGLIAIRNSAMRFNQGLTNLGQVSIGPGSTDLFGDVDNVGTISLSDGATVSIVGDLKQNGVINLPLDSRMIVYANFTGAGGTSGAGTLEVLGSLSVGNSPAAVAFGGNVILGPSTGTVIELGGHGIGDFDRLTVGGEVTLAGRLVVELINGFIPSPGDVFEIITAADGVQGTFLDTLFPSVASASWSVLYGPNNVSILLEPSNTLPGDFNRDGIVDAADYVVWRDGLGTVYTLDHYDQWKAHFGQTAGGGAVAAAAAVPEPAAFWLLAVGVIIGGVARRRP